MKLDYAGMRRDVMEMANRAYATWVKSRDGGRELMDFRTKCIDFAIYLGEPRWIASRYDTGWKAVSEGMMER